MSDTVYYLIIIYDALILGMVIYIAIKDKRPY